MSVCAFDGCDRAVHSKGLCNAHYQQQRRGEPLRPFTPRRHLGLPPTDDLLEALVWRCQRDDNDCWNWQGSITPTGYGMWTWDGKGKPAHRWMWEVMVGPIPDGMELDHLCRNRACQNVDHMEAVTRAENVRRSEPYRRRGDDNHNGAKTHCPQGHPYDGDNLRVWNGRRICRACNRQRSASWYAASKAT